MLRLLDGRFSGIELRYTRSAPKLIRVTLSMCGIINVPNSKWPIPSAVKDWRVYVAVGNFHRYVRQSKFPKLAGWFQGADYREMMIQPAFVDVQTPNRWAAWCRDLAGRVGENWDSLTKGANDAGHKAQS